MARLLTRRPNVSYEEKRKRASRTRLIGNKSWIDPYGHIQGTLPEKMVYAELVKRQIPFYFQTETDFDLPEIGLFKKYRPDFVLFNDKTIIEVQGAYWHSRTETQEADAYKFAIYSTSGWKVIVWWDYDIVRNLSGLIASESVFNRYNLVGYKGISEVVTARKRSIDDSLGIKTLNYRRGLRQLYKKKAVNIKGLSRG